MHLSTLSIAAKIILSKACEHCGKEITCNLYNGVHAAEFPHGNAYTSSCQGIG